MPSALSGLARPRGILQVHIGGLAGGVGEQHAHGDLRSLGVVIRIERWKDCSMGSSKLKLALLVELHDGGRCREVLRERGHVEDGVLCHALGSRGPAVEARFAGELAVAVGALEDDAAAMADDEDGAGKPAFSDALIDERGDNCEVRSGYCGRTLRGRLMMRGLLGCACERETETQKQERSHSGRALGPRALSEEEARERANQEGGSRADEDVPGVGDVRDRDGTEVTGNALRPQRLR